MSKRKISSIQPDVHVTHNREKYDIQFELSGVSPQDIDLKVSESSLCLYAPRDDYFDFNTCVGLAHRIDTEKVEAKFKNGLLSVSVPIIEPLKGREVEIE